jgi:competence protein ComEC
VFLTYTIEVVGLTAQIPHASVPVQMQAWMVWTYYALLGGLTWWLAKPVERRRGVFDEFRSRLWGRVRDGLSSGVKPKLLLGSSAIVLVLALAAWRSLPDGQLHITFLDVGQGDAVFIQTPGGRQVLIDGGPNPSVLLSQLGRRMPFWDRTLDLAVLTHPDSDHITGLIAALERYQVDGVVWRDMGCQDPVCERWRQLLPEEGAVLYRGEMGLDIALDRGLRMEVLHPGAELLAVEGFNDNSIVTRLSYGEFSVLLTGDITAQAEQQLVGSGSSLASTVLKAPHHGSCGSTTPSFLEAVDPEAVVISVGEENEFDHPCDEVLELLSGRRVYLTQEHGTVELITDGARLWVETE